MDVSSNGPSQQPDIIILDGETISFVLPILGNAGVLNFPLLRFLWVETADVSPVGSLVGWIRGCFFLGDCPAGYFLELVYPLTSYCCCCCGCCGCVQPQRLHSEFVLPSHDKIIVVVIAVPHASLCPSSPLLT